MFTRTILVRQLSTLAGGRQIIGKFTKTPLTLFRIGSREVKLRDFKKQMEKGSTSFDFTLKEDGKIHPATGDIFIGPNGMSLRPEGINMWDILGHYRGKTSVTIIPQGVDLPEGLILLHEHGDHYSLQTTIACTPANLNKRITQFLQPFEEIPKAEYFVRYPLPQ